MTKPCDENGFMKFDHGKSRPDLIPPAFIEAMGHVMAYGAEKYAEENWKLNTNPRRYEAAMFRHLLAYLQNKNLDEESGLPHLAHLAINAAFLYWMEGAKQDVVPGELPPSFIERCGKMYSRVSRGVYEKGDLYCNPSSGFASPAVNVIGDNVLLHADGGYYCYRAV